MIESINMVSKGKIGSLWLFSFLADIASIITSYYLAIIIRFKLSWGAAIMEKAQDILGMRKTPSPEGLLQDYYDCAFRRILILSVVICVLYAMRGLYPGRRYLRKRAVAWDIIAANVIALVLFLTYFYIRSNTFHPRSIFILIAASNIVFSVLFRSLSALALGHLRNHGYDRHKAIILGAGKPYDFLVNLIQAKRPHGIEICDRRQRGERVCCGDGYGDAEREMLSWLEGSIERNGADMIILADRASPMSEIMSVLELAGRSDLAVKVLSSQLDVLLNSARMSSDLIQGVPLVHFERPSVEKRSALARAAFSWLVAIIGTVIALPFMAVIAVLIKLTSAGPVLFVQERMGCDDKPFKMLKFRTMYENADQQQAEMEAYNELGSTLFKIKRDPRVTPMGSFLRRFSLDELPQLFNVLKGQMRIVGPRPLSLRDYGRDYEAWHYQRHQGTPGMTCLWQVSGRSELTFRDMCILDIYYLRNASFILDIKILLRTCLVVLFARGAY